MTHAHATNGYSQVPRYIAYARCAAVDGSPSRLEEQIRVIRRFGDLRTMRCVDEVRVAGVNGCVPVIRDDLRQLLERKRATNDFCVLIVESVPRLTRAGDDAVATIEAAFRSHGVDIMYVAEADWVEGP